MGYKIERLQQVIKFKVSQVLLKDISDPRLGLVTITRVKLAKDLSHCVVYYSVLGEAGERSRSAHALANARGFIQHEVAGALATRTTPRLDFEFDPSIEGSVRIAEMLRRELGPTDSQDDDDA